MATARAPIVPLAPGLFSTMIDCPSWADNCSKTILGMMSAALPGLNGMMARIGLLGQSSARLPVMDARTAHTIAKTRAVRLLM